MIKSRVVKMLYLELWLCSSRFKFARGGKIIQKLIRVLFSCDISEKIKLGDGLVLWHSGLGVVIGSGTEIGNDVQIFQNVTIGNKYHSGVPSIGNHVIIGTGAVVLGKIKIGDNVLIGANSVVLDDVKDNCFVAGAPAVVIGTNKYTS